MADSLSRDKHLSDDKLTNLFFPQIPEQTPRNFRISPLPEEMSSYLLSKLQKLPIGTQQHEKHKATKISLGINGNISFTKSNVTQICSYLNSIKDNKPSLFLRLFFIIKPTLGFCLRQSMPLWTTYLRPSETLTSQTQGSTKTICL